MFYLYVLESEKHKIFYVGYSSNPEARFLQHNETSLDSFTCRFRPWTLKTVIPISNNESDVVRVERYVKKQKQKRFTKLLIEKSNDPDFTKWLVEKSLAG